MSQSKTVSSASTLRGPLVGREEISFFLPKWRWPLCTEYVHHSHGLLCFWDIVLLGAKFRTRRHSPRALREETTWEDLFTFRIFMDLTMKWWRHPLNVGESALRVVCLLLPHISQEHRQIVLKVSPPQEY